MLRRQQAEPSLPPDQLFRRGPHGGDMALKELSSKSWVPLDDCRRGSHGRNLMLYFGRVLSPSGGEYGQRCN